MRYTPGISSEGCTGGNDSSVSSKHQKMKGKRPSRPPASDSGSPNTSTSEDDDDGCEIVRHHRRPPRPMMKKPSTTPPPSASDTSIYHSGCCPEQPNRNFKARPAPRGILKGDYLLMYSFGK